jgi:hypothetical protein
VRKRDRERERVFIFLEISHHPDAVDPINFEQLMMLTGFHINSCETRKLVSLKSNLTIKRSYFNF